jgi:hypothetical protein
MFRAWLYARVSTNDQQTLAIQNRAMREYAARRGWMIAMQVREVNSGAARREVRERLLEGLWKRLIYLGLMERVKDHFADAVAPKAEEITNAFWCACHGGQRETAEYLLARGASINWVGYDKLTPLDAANRSNAKELVEWLVSQGAKSVHAT